MCHKQTKKVDNWQIRIKQAKTTHALSFHHSAILSIMKITKEISDIYTAKLCKSWMTVGQTEAIIEKLDF